MDVSLIVLLAAVAVIQVTGSTLSMLSKSPVYIQAHALLEMKCVFKSISPNGVVRWFKGSVELSSPDFTVLKHQGYEILDNGDMLVVTTSTLTKNSIGAGDSGRYSCRVESLNEDIDVRVVTFQNTPEVVTNPGNPITVKCNVGSLAVKMKTKWKKDGVSLSALPELLQRIVFKDHKTTLEINNSSYSDTGKYECEMTAQEGEQQGNITHDVIIFGRPYFLDGNNQTEPHHGKAGLELRCVPSGYPSPVISWTKDSADLVTKATVMLHSHENIKKAVIRFTDFQVDDTGLYSCEAKNKHGSTVRNFQILEVSGAQSVFRRTHLVPLFLCLFTLGHNIH
ncbi:zwei Ig domain protein zig-1-like [Gigantopelta aegis]|uniref:zwei Ig domain protein zig-1-like n=1 Tax=Gigantopelta aegis TaxID=1735272 RepID=UPI001B88A8D5|nr:zwei Ig domain protein zig-1-like [Gigantopelta aegis]XP_041371674.1 zwei Ig domain protein zig-1-like [Gigantopelta aegis]XP_041371680.1 zwei Ig domain protein zig-1-like [Gigantopelta aegis]XP_041371690.1 zwei Ig domain protein zig-1-like [Gigantopelta aegis]